MYLAIVLPKVSSISLFDHMNLKIGMATLLRNSRSTNILD